MGEKTKHILFLAGIFLLAFIAVLIFRRWQSAPMEANDGTAAKENFTLASGPALSPRNLPLLTQLNQEYSKVTENVVKSVVSLDTEGRASTYTLMPGYSPHKDYKVRSLGSGVIVSRQGHIITNNHVIKGKQAIRVRLWDGRVFPARKVGEDKIMDLAVLKIEVGENLTPLAFGDSDKVEVGHIVFAIGNPFGLGETVTQGIISAKQRSFGDLQSELIQTDASINPGNSGGPLVNILGEIIGINAAIYSDDDQNVRSLGVGFSIPSNLVKNIFEQICIYGKPIRGYLGVSLLDPSPQIREMLGYEQGSGVAVNELHSGSPAAKAGVLTGDIIQTYNGEKVTSARDLLQLIHNSKIGKKVTLGIWRKGQQKSINLAVAEAGAPIVNDIPVPEGVQKMNKLGLHLRNLTLEECAAGAKGLLVTAVDEGSAATRNRNNPAFVPFSPGDLLLTVDGKPLNTQEDLTTLLKNERVTVTVFRGRNDFRFSLRIDVPQLGPPPLPDPIPEKKTSSSLQIP